MKKVFAFGIREPEIAQVINFIRFASNPLEKRKAHITVIGPVEGLDNIEVKSTQIIGKKVLVLGAGSFFEGKQNTVFLKCVSGSIKAIWRKKFKEYVPHISIYDGKSRNFAEQILNILNKVDITFYFHATELFEIQLHKSQLSMDLLMEIDFDFIRKITKVGLDPENLSKYSENKRLGLILSAAAFLNKKKIEELKIYKPLITNTRA